MKKIALFIVTLLVAVVLVGCTSSETKPNTNNTGNNTQGGGTTARTKSPDAFLVDQIELTEGDSFELYFWHIWGQQKSAVHR